MKPTKSVRYIRGIVIRYAAFWAGLVLVACDPAAVTKLQSTNQAVDTQITQVSASLPLSEPGPYRIGVCEFSAQDASRSDREVGVRVWNEDR